MKQVSSFGNLYKTAAVLACILVLLCCATSVPAASQSANTAQADQKPAPPQTQAPPPPRSIEKPEAAPGAQQPGTQSSKPAAEPEKKITAQEADELFRSVDEILQFASKDTHLPILHPVKRELASRDIVRSYIAKHMEEDQDAQRLQRSSASLKKFGLVPRDFDLKKFLLDVLQEQVAGYYDPKTKTVYLLDWVNAEAQRPVLAHELTHALQDQSFDLERWLKVTKSSDQKPNTSLDDTRYEPEEEQAARESVSEGQAMAVLVDYTIAPSGKSIAESPMIAQFFRQSTVENTGTSPILAGAPLYLRESLIFAYTYGLDFVAQLLARGGKEMAFAGAMKKPPHDTREIMTPKAYLSDQHVPPFYLPRLSPVLGNKFEKYDLGSVGEFDVYVLLKQYNGLDVAEGLAPAWRGGTYMLVRRTDAKTKPDANSQPDLRDLALVYLSRWASPEDAGRFAGAYAASLPKKYKSVKPGGVRTGNSIVIDNNRYITDEGLVFVEPHDDRVLVMEGFDEATAGLLRDVVLARERVAIEPGLMLGLQTPAMEA
ncbi:MAG: hypothetical protein JOY79_06620, partial [Acidobacteriaceae bacterium]|nr:hypothetical protein [Acidobacteriaceae bacterium]